MKQYTDITVLLDRSGSMSAIKGTMEGALDEFFNAQKQVPSTRASLIQFDSVNPYELIFENRPIIEVPKVVIEPRGNTPLIDSLCKTIDQTGNRLAAMSESNRPDQVLFVIITDGRENWSKEYRKSDVRNRITKQRNDYKWQFTFFGSDEQGFNEAVSWGVPIADSVWFDLNRSDMAIRSLASTTTAYTTSVGNARGQSLNGYDESTRKKLNKNWKSVVTDKQSDSKSESK